MACGLRWPRDNCLSLPSPAAPLTYDNRFVSVITVRDRKVAHWRDYLDPVAVLDAIG